MINNAIILPDKQRRGKRVLDKNSGLYYCKRHCRKSGGEDNHLEELTMRQAVGDEAGKILALLGDVNAKLRSGALPVIYLERLLRGEDTYDVPNLFHFARWNQFFREAFGLDILNLGKTPISEYRRGFADVIIVPECLGLSRISLRLRELHHPGSYFDHMTNELSQPVRRKAETYAVRCRNTVCPDTKYFNGRFFADDHELRMSGRASMQLIEYLLYNMYREFYGLPFCDIHSHTVFLDTQFKDGSYCVADFFNREQDLNVASWLDSVPEDTGPREVLVA
ncbi:MAG: hypothetical protein UT02_C0002G0020 [Parcubacteria group bacterium GW2011_GWC2_38_7]|nr:MAG: hypothetical protein UT02_C0002G0020 [Parcubacteria group bacterium GW2011_GWC2_38_7]